MIVRASTGSAHKKTGPDGQFGKTGLDGQFGSARALRAGQDQSRLLPGLTGPA
jgi:hypothetical protein